jgi:hypothetical protein
MLHGCKCNSFVAFHDDDAGTSFAVQVQVAPNIVIDLICDLNTSKFMPVPSACHQQHLSALLYIFPFISAHVILSIEIAPQKSFVPQ